MGIRLLVSILLLPSVVVSAQKGRVLAATEQCWSGGIAGRHGCNYNFVLAFSNVKQGMKVDTIWIGEYAVKLTEKNNNSTQGNMTVKREKKTMVYDINARTAYDDNTRYSLNSKLGETTAPKPPESGGAVAVMTYWYGGEKRYFKVPKILRRYAPVAYP